MIPMISSITSHAAASGSSGAGQNSSAASSPNANPVDKNMFLQLMVAQLRNQDPLNPTDGTTFVTQLAQFQQLEQSVNSGQDVSSILADLNQLVSTNSSGGSSPQSST